MMSKDKETQSTTDIIWASRYTCAWSELPLEFSIKWINDPPPLHIYSFVCFLLLLFYFHLYQFKLGFSHLQTKISMDTGLGIFLISAIIILSMWTPFSTRAAVLTHLLVPGPHSPYVWTRQIPFMCQYTGQLSLPPACPSWCLLLCPVTICNLTHPQQGSAPLTILLLLHHPLKCIFSSRTINLTHWSQFGTRQRHSQLTRALGPCSSPGPLLLAFLISRTRRNEGF